MKAKNTFPLLGDIMDIAWTGDGKRIIVAGMGNPKFAKAIMWDSGNSVGEISGHISKILTTDVRVQRPFRCVTGGEDFGVKFHNGPPYKFDSTFKGHEKYVNCLRYSPDGEYLASCGSDSRIHLFEGKTGEMKMELKSNVGKKDAHSGSVYSLSWTPDSKSILTASGDKTAKLWDVESGTLKQTFTLAENPKRAQASDMQISTLAHGDHLISVSLSGAINYLDPANPEKPSKVLMGSQATISAYDIDIKSGQLFVGDFGGKVSQWDTQTNTATWFTGKGHGKQIVSVQVSGDSLYTTGLDNTLRISDIKSRSFSDGAIQLGSMPCSLATGNTSGLVAVGLAKGVVIVVKDGAVVSNTDVSKQVKADPFVAFNADDSQLLVGGKNGKLLVFSVDASGNLVATSITGKMSREVIRVGFNAGKWMAVDGNRCVSLLDTKDLTEVNFGWKYSKTSVTGAAFSPSGKMLATSNLVGEVILYFDLVEFDGKRLLFETGHDEGIEGVTWLSDTRLITLGRDKVIKLWDVPDSF